MKIILISCSSKKLNTKAKVKDLYISHLFKFNLKYAKSLNPDRIFILSAKYGLLDLEKEIEPYDETLNDMTAKEIKNWSDKVANQLKNYSNLEKDEFILLAGERYRRYLTHHINNFKIPLEGLSIGKQLEYLKQVI